MHAERINASQKHASAIRTLRVAEMGNDVAAWEAAERAANETRAALVAAEKRWPTKVEIARQRRELEMSNRGIRK